MGRLKSPKIEISSRAAVTNNSLLRKMSEVISLREQVAQAELKASLFNPLTAVEAGRGPLDEGCR